MATHCRSLGTRRQWDLFRKKAHLLKRQVNRLHKSRPSDLSYMERRHHLEWHRIQKNGSPNRRRRRDRLEVIFRINSTSAMLVDLLDGRLMGQPPLMEMTRGSPVPSEVVVILTTDSRHRLLEASYTGCIEEFLKAENFFKNTKKKTNLISLFCTLKLADRKSVV